eukprot:gene35854-48216_t
MALMKARSVRRSGTPFSVLRSMSTCTTRPAFNVPITNRLPLTSLDTFGATGGGVRLQAMPAERICGRPTPDAAAVDSMAAGGDAGAMSTGAGAGELAVMVGAIGGGASRARNVALDRIGAPYAAILDVDDRFKPAKLKEAVAAL